MEHLTPAQLDELEVLDKAALPGPWYMEQPWAGFSGFRAKADSAPAFYTAAPDVPLAEENHAVALHARNALPALIAMVRELQRIKPALVEWATERRRYFEGCPEGTGLYADATARLADAIPAEWLEER